MYSKVYIVREILNSISRYCCLMLQTPTATMTHNLKPLIFNLFNCNEELSNLHIVTLLQPTTSHYTA